MLLLSILYIDFESWIWNQIFLPKNKDSSFFSIQSFTSIDGLKNLKILQVRNDKYRSLFISS